MRRAATRLGSFSRTWHPRRWVCFAKKPGTGAGLGSFPQSGPSPLRSFPQVRAFPRWVRFHRTNRRRVPRQPPRLRGRAAPIATPRISILHDVKQPTAPAPLGAPGKPRRGRDTLLGLSGSPLEKTPLVSKAETTYTMICFRSQDRNSKSADATRKVMPFPQSPPLGGTKHWTVPASMKR
jgi:hypothetical protein